MSWHLFDEFFVVRVSYFLNGFPSLLLAASFFVVRDGVALFERIIRFFWFDIWNIASQLAFLSSF